MQRPYCRMLYTNVCIAGCYAQIYVFPRRYMQCPYCRTLYTNDHITVRYTQTYVLPDVIHKRTYCRMLYTMDSFESCGNYISSYKDNCRFHKITMSGLCSALQLFPADSNNVPRPTPFMKRAETIYSFLSKASARHSSICN